MKKLLNLACMIMAAMSIISCGGGSSSSSVANENGTVVVFTPNGEREIIEVEVPFNPQRIVCLNTISVDILDRLGLGDRIVGMLKNDNNPSYLKKYNDDESIAKVGTGLKDVDMEAIMALEPDLILSSNRTSANYDEFIKIAPTVSSAILYENGFYQGFKDNLINHAKMFGKENDLDDIFAEYEARIEAINAKASGKTAILGIASGGRLRTLGDRGNASIITTDMGFENLAPERDVNHGDISSYELILKLNPDYLFVLDRGSAVGEGSTTAKEMLDNEIIHQTSAWKNGNIVYLEPGLIWYTADGGITSMDILISNIEEGTANL